LLWEKPTEQSRRQQGFGLLFGRVFDSATVVIRLDGPLAGAGGAGKGIRPSDEAVFLGLHTERDAAAL
jgi:hypothetical protein